MSTKRYVTSNAHITTEMFENQLKGGKQGEGITRAEMKEVEQQMKANADKWLELTRDSLMSARVIIELLVRMMDSGPESTLRSAFAAGMQTGYELGIEHPPLGMEGNVKLELTIEEVGRLRDIVVDYIGSVHTMTLPNEAFTPSQSARITFAEQLKTQLESIVKTTPKRRSSDAPAS